MSENIDQKGILTKIPQRGAPHSGLYWSKLNDISKTFDFFLTDDFNNNQLIYKLINELEKNNVIDNSTLTSLKQAITQYKIALIGILAECDELHIRLYDRTEKNYKRKSFGFYNCNK